MRFFPVFLDLQAGTVALFGGGEPARNKLRLLRASGARVRWHLEDVAAAAGLADETVTVVPFGVAGEPHLADVIAVFSAAGDPIDTRVATHARSMRIPVNVVDRPELSSFIVPAIIDRGEIVVAIGTGGAAPVLARRLRERIEALLPARIGALAALMGRYRERLAAARTSALARRAFWERVVDGPIAAALLSGRTLEAEAALVRSLAAGRHSAMPSGTVFMVGAGPGDPDLLTLRALHALQGADVVFHDADVTGAVLDRARRDAERISVGVADEIGRRLALAARGGRQVVRLFGGDSSASGPAAQELATLREAGVPIVVVPGVNAIIKRAASVDAREAA